MGDRCCFAIWVLADDAESEKGEAILAEWFDEPLYRQGQRLHYSCDDMNWGGSSFVEEWAFAGFMCVGSQAGGQTYDPSEFCTTGGEIRLGKGTYVGLYEVYGPAGEGRYTIGFDENGVPDPDELSYIQGFLRLRGEIQARMEWTPVERLAAANASPE